MNWNKASDPPKENGRYLVVIKNRLTKGYTIAEANWCDDLYKLDKYDFNDRKGIAGWYRLYYAYCEIDNVLYWTDIPELPEELINE